MAFKPISKSSSKNPLLSPQEKKHRRLTYVLLGILFITFVIFYFGFFYSPSAPPPSETETAISLTESSDVESAIRKIDFDANFFKDSQFQVLEIYGEWPLIIGETGRENPFLPY